VIKTSDAIVLDLSSVSLDKESDPISYRIVNRKVVYNPNVDCMDSPVYFNSEDDMYIENKSLKVKNMEDCGTKYIMATIKATAKGGSNNTQVKFSLNK
jgi:hypothetical protein